MMNKIGGLARALYILLAIVAGFVALGGMNMAMILLVLGLIAGMSMPRDRIVLAGVIVMALPIVGTALGTLPAIGAQLAAIMVNLQMALAGAMATAIAMLCLRAGRWKACTGLTAGEASSRGTAATAG